MKKISAIVLGVILVAGAAFAMGQVSQSQSYSFRYQLTVEIDTPEGIKTGSAVRQVNARYEPRLLSPPKNYYPKIQTIGEAVVVDLGDRGTVFAKISLGDYMQVTQTFEGADIYLRTPESAAFYSSLEIGTKADMHAKHYPWLYTFTDLSDPLSVKLVKGGRFSVETQDHLMEDNFEELFGQGVSLKSMSVEITDEPVTHRVDDLLPWLTNLKNNKARLNGKSSIAVFTNELADNLGSGNFSIGAQENER